MDSRGQLDGHLDAWLAVDAASGHRAALMQLTGVLSLPLGALAMWPGWFSDIGARTSREGELTPTSYLRVRGGTSSE